MRKTVPVAGMVILGLMLPAAATAKPTVQPVRSAYHKTAGQTAWVRVRFKGAKATEWLAILQFFQGKWVTIGRSPLRGHAYNHDRSANVWVRNLPVGHFWLDYELQTRSQRILAVSRVWSISVKRPPPPPTFSPPEILQQPPPGSHAVHGVTAHASSVNFTPQVGCGGTAADPGVYNLDALDTIDVNPEIANSTGYWAYIVILFQYDFSSGQWVYNVASNPVIGDVGYNPVNTEIRVGASGLEDGLIDDTIFTTAGDPGYFYPVVYYWAWNGSTWSFQGPASNDVFTQFDPSYLSYTSDTCEAYSSRAG